MRHHVARDSGRHSPARHHGHDVFRSVFRYGLVPQKTEGRREGYQSFEGDGVTTLKVRLMSLLSSTELVLLSCIVSI